MSRQQVPRFEVAEEILIDGETVLVGNGTLGVIYNNLAGLNITDAAEYDQYLRFMANHLCLKSLSSANTMQFFANKQEVARCQIGDPKAVRVTIQSELEVLRAQFAALQSEMERLELQNARGEDTFATDARLEAIDKLMVGSPLCIDPDRGIIMKCEV